MTKRWLIAEDGSVISPNGARCAMVLDGCLYLYDKRIRASVAFTLEDHLGLLGMNGQDLISSRSDALRSTPETSFQDA